MYQSRQVRDCLAESLVYPRSMAIARISARTCPRSGCFNEADGRCRQCAKEPECRWLSSISSYPDVAAMSTSELAEVLDMAIEFVCQHNSHHDRCTCDCLTCSWLRDTRHLLKRYRRQ